MPVLSEYDYVFAIGTMFALLEAYNNGANDVANAWATSVSSRSVTYPQAMLLCLIFELTGALTVGARTASTIKNGIIPVEAFRENAGVQLLAFTCASAGAALWVQWCTTHSAHVSSTYSLISAIAGVGIATVGASQVQWGWNDGQGLGAIFAGLFMAPAISACFGAAIFMLIKTIVHMRKNPVPWAVWTSPFFFLIAGVVCCLSIVYKGSPRLGLADRPAWWIAVVSLGTGLALALLSALFFVPYVHCKVIKKDRDIRAWEMIYGPLLFRRPAPAGSEQARVPNYAVVQHDAEDDESTAETSAVSYEKKANHNSSDEEITAVSPTQAAPKEKNLVFAEVSQASYQKLLADALEKHHAKLRKSKSPLGWAMRTVHNHPFGAGSIYERHNLKAVLYRLPAIPVICLMYGLYYDIHTAQVGIMDTPDGRRMARVYDSAPKYPNEVEHLYSFVQIITACTASFAHGANDVGNAVGVWAAMYSAWSTGTASAAKNPVELWQIAVMALTICFGFITYGYNIMKVMGNKITYHSPSRGSSMEMGAAITVMIFSQESLPVSTSMCITGATVGVGLCNGTFKAVNWQRVALLVFSWIMTIPIAGLIGGLLMGIVLNAPHF
ncbi:phosphate transporter [Stachybotrys elegans]|uniref:Phosphate transporter n=1 Tax=Stachybotrys elegans TaxID=80388 RepID=A0A8K0WYE4_9HYPO|nr:phosphate transporter [Stachybotrys elegans]